MQDEDQCECSSDIYASFTIEDLRAQVDQNVRGEHRLIVPELHYVVDDEVLRRVVDGQGIETIGQFALDPSGEARRLEMDRIVGADSEADEIRLSISVEFPSAPPAFDSEASYPAAGKMRYPDEGGEIVAILEAERVTETPEALPEDDDWASCRA